MEKPSEDILELATTVDCAASLEAGKLNTDKIIPIPEPSWPQLNDENTFVCSTILNDKHYSSRMSKLWGKKCSISLLTLNSPHILAILPVPVGTPYLLWTRHTLLALLPVPVGTLFGQLRSWNEQIFQTSTLHTLYNSTQFNNNSIICQS